MKRRCTVFPTEDMYGLDILICWWWGGGGGGVLRVGAITRSLFYLSICLLFQLLAHTYLSMSIYLSIYLSTYLT